jgi:very-short-patch-repair endonuclease
MNNLKEHNSKPEPTIFAKRLHSELKNIGINSELEKSDGYKHIDIAITKAFINIEIDGIHHSTEKDQARRDLQRHYYSYIKGYNTIRIPNSLLKEEKDIKETAYLIKKMIQEKPKQYNEKYCNKIREEAKNNKIKGIIIGAVITASTFITAIAATTILN